MLEDLGRYGNVVWKLNQFVDAVAMETSSSSSAHSLNENNTSGDTSGTCQTYQAFSIAISHVLRQFKRELVSMEMEICAQGIYKMLTLHSRSMMWVITVISLKRGCIFLFVARWNISFISTHLLWWIHVLNG